MTQRKSHHVTRICFAVNIRLVTTPMFVLRVVLGMVRRDGGICCFLFIYIFDTLTVSMYFFPECTIHTFSQNSFQQNLSIARGKVMLTRVCISENQRLNSRSSGCLNLNEYQILCGVQMRMK